ncbi:MAG TPA: hypothetical protein VLM85_13560 [Polyangiaceae bacterium]|nr:hypothetical protein [Polyangiaceae bacterium]
MSRGSWLVLSSLAIAAAMLACGARTGLREGELETSDATSDHASDHAGDRHDSAIDAADAADAADAHHAADADADTYDAPYVYDGPVALCGTCSTDLNANGTFNPNVYQGATWLAYELPVGCDQFAAWIAIHADTSEVRVYADDGTGKPGAEILAPTPTQPVGDAGWFEVPANLQLLGGHSYFVATSLVPYYPKTNTHCPFATSGAATRWYGSFQGGPWQGPYYDNSMIRAGDCP